LKKKKEEEPKKRIKSNKGTVQNRQFMSGHYLNFESRIMEIDVNQVA
jgi:hypothetical protein